MFQKISKLIKKIYAKKNQTLLYTFLDTQMRQNTQQCLNFLCFGCIRTLRLRSSEINPMFCVDASFC